jgi:transcriptional regulator with XRE-family HTH domain
MPTAATTAARLRELRLACGFTLRALGDESGVNFRRILVIEQGAKPTQRELQLLAVALEMPVAELEG